MHPPVPNTQALERKIRGEEGGAMMKQYWYEQGKKEVARNLLEDGVDLTVVLRVTGLSPEDLKPDAPADA